MNEEAKQKIPSKPLSTKKKHQESGNEDNSSLKNPQLCTLSDRFVNSLDNFSNFFPISDHGKKVSYLNLQNSVGQKSI